VAQKRRTRGYIEQRASGSYRAVVYAGADPLTGKPRYLRASAATWDDAERELTRLLGELDQERHPKTDITVGLALDQWLDVADLAETTRRESCSRNDGREQNTRTFTASQNLVRGLRPKGATDGDGTARYPSLGAARVVEHRRSD
jgi:hypothetical protein